MGVHGHLRLYEGRGRWPQQEAKHEKAARKEGTVFAFLAGRMRVRVVNNAAFAHFKILLFISAVAVHQSDSPV